MKEIKLTQGKFAQVDDSDFEYLNQFKWQAAKDKNTFYAVRTIGQKKGETKRRISLHRIIMNTPERLEVDHIDHNGLNCQKSNLRNCTHLENGKNLMRINGACKFKGVHINRCKYITAHIRVNNKSLHLGTFKNEHDAAIAYDNASIKYYGEYGLTNFKKVI